MDVRMSKIWRERFLDLIRIVALLLSFHILMFALSGDPEKYDILAIIPIEAGIVIFLIILLGEQMRVHKFEIEEKDDKIVELESELRKLKTR